VHVPYTTIALLILHRDLQVPGRTLIYLTFLLSYLAIGVVRLYEMSFGIHEVERRVILELDELPDVRRRSLEGLTTVRCDGAIIYIYN